MSKKCWCGKWAFDAGLCKVHFGAPPMSHSPPSRSPPPPSPWLVGNTDDGTKFWYQSHDPSNILFSEPVPSPPAEIALPVGVEFCLLHHASGKSKPQPPHPPLLQCKESLYTCHRATGQALGVDSFGAYLHPTSQTTCYPVSLQPLTRASTQTMTCDADGCISVTGMPGLVLTGSSAARDVLCFHPKVTCVGVTCDV
jgi:hypothetical protein